MNLHGHIVPMSIHRDTTFPRAAVPHSIGTTIRAERILRRWSQARLAAKVGVTRRTIMRVELGQHVPTAHLVFDLEEALDLPALVPAWPEPLRPSTACYGPRVRQARLAAGVTVAAAAAVAGVSPSSFSRFEAGASVRALVGGFEAADEGVRSDALANLLGFDDAYALNAHCRR